MGTTFQAQVEVYFSGAPYTSTVDHVTRIFHTPPIWQAVSRWELQKDYSFAMAWSVVAQKGWPEGVLLIGERPDPKWGYDLEQTYCGTGEQLCSLPIDSDSRPWFLHLREHVKNLLAGKYKVRVLTWGE